MSQVCNYGCGTLEDHEQVLCGEYKNGGFSGVGIDDCASDISDYSDAAEWTSAIAAGHMKVIKGIKGELPEATAVEGESAVGCGPENEVYTYDRTFTFTDSNVSAANTAFYNSLKKRRVKIVPFACDSDEVLPVQYIANVDAKLVVPRSNGERQHYMVTFRWRGLDDPVAVDAPAGIF
jgi:hypothetical protein